MKEIDKVKETLSKPLQEAGYELAKVWLSHAKDGLTLHICVDRDASISLDDIVKVSDLINPLLDDADPIPGPYTLDVSSMGLEKPVKPERLNAYLGCRMHLHLTKPFEGRNDLEGDLAAVDAETVTVIVAVKAKRKEMTLPRQNIDKARLAIKF